MIYLSVQLYALCPVLLGVILSLSTNCLIMVRATLISMVQKSTSFPRSFFGVILMVQKSTFFPPTFFGEISLVEISTSFTHTFFRCNLMVEKPMLFSLAFFDVILMVEKSTLFARSSFNNISTSRDLLLFAFLVKLQANENIGRGFPLLVTLKNLYLHEFSL